VNKTANVLNKLPKSAQPKAKDALHQIWMAPTRNEVLRAFDLFVKTYEAKYPKATACLVKDKDELLVFYDFPAEHWKHLRTTSRIESTFATVRLRTKRTKGAGSRIACLTMVFKLVQSAERKRRKLDGYALLGGLIRGVQFKDGTKVAA
jgi:putative transposase